MTRARTWALTEDITLRTLRDVEHLPFRLIAQTLGRTINAVIARYHYKSRFDGSIVGKPGKKSRKPLPPRHYRTDWNTP